VVATAIGQPIDMTFFLVSTALFLGGIGVVVWIHDQHHLDIVVEPASPPRDAPLVSVCIPARNEERNIRACVESMLGQDYPDFEVIVLDDRSTDATSRILADLAGRDSRIRVINGSELPPGWVGKPHALHQASAAARGEWLCFVDADTFAAREALSSCYATAIDTRADLFTMMTFQILGSFWEKVVMPLVMTALAVGFSPRKVNDPNRKDIIANGQFIFIKRSVYESIGGHASVKDQIVEDKALAGRVKSNGFRLIVADGRQLARTRMYRSLPEMWEGWTKNIYPGLRDRAELLWLGVFGALLAVVAALFMPLWPLLGLARYLSGGGLPALGVIVESLILWAVLIYARARVAVGMRISAWYALSTPLGAAVFCAMMVVSAWKVLTHQGVTWKGRSYKV
jgi:chlorobactene glucosyltransferase